MAELVAGAELVSLSDIVEWFSSGVVVAPALVSVSCGLISVLCLADAFLSAIVFLGRKMRSIMIHHTNKEIANTDVAASVGTVKSSSMQSPGSVSVGTLKPQRIVKRVRGYKRSEHCNRLQTSA